MEHYELLESSTLGEIHVMSDEEVRAQLEEWRTQQSDTKNPAPEEPDDTQPLSHAEIAAKQFEGRCLAILGGEKMTGGKLCDQNAFKVARHNLRREVGEVMADEIMSDFFASNTNLFT